MSARPASAIAPPIPPSSQNTRRATLQARASPSLSRTRENSGTKAAAMAPSAKKVAEEIRDPERQIEGVHRVTGAEKHRERLLADEASPSTRLRKTADPMAPAFLIKAAAGATAVSIEIRPWSS